MRARNTLHEHVSHTRTSGEASGAALALLGPFILVLSFIRNRHPIYFSCASFLGSFPPRRTPVRGHVLNQISRLVLRRCHFDARGRRANEGRYLYCPLYSNKISVTPGVMFLSLCRRAPPPAPSDPLTAATTA